LKTFFCFSTSFWGWPRRIYLAGSNPRQLGTVNILGLLFPQLLPWFFLYRPPLIHSRTPSWVLVSWKSETQLLPQLVVFFTSHAVQSTQLIVFLTSHAGHHPFLLPQESLPDGDIILELRFVMDRSFPFSE
jgi:hypothetical protein